MSSFATFALGPSTLWVGVLTLATCMLLFRNRRLVRGTTLVGPWLWLLFSMCVIGCSHLVAAITNGRSGGELGNWQSALLFGAAASSFCPLMSLLGAKRPQDRGWHFVVFSLWAILVLPVAESVVLRHSQMPDVHGARSWFMLILIGLGIANALPTRFWLASVLFGGGQVLMLAKWLPIVRHLVETSPTIAGFSCCALASAITTLIAFRKAEADSSLDAVWRDFRDTFGLLWGLRIAEQINVVARSADWPLTLRWRGFVDKQGNQLEFDSLPDETRKSVRQVIQNLLRRFVSSEWIAERTGEPVK